MGEDCGNCKRKWEEELYWNRFQSPQFFQSLSGKFHHQLAIPKKFANNLREKLSETVALKGPSGITWNVGVAASDDTLFFRHGWKEFVNDNYLEKDDVLIFKYIGGSHFDVLMFDRTSLCEKEASYFVRKCSHPPVDCGRHPKRGRTERIEVMIGPSHDTIGYTSLENSREAVIWTPETAGRRPHASGKIHKGANCESETVSSRKDQKKKGKGGKRGSSSKKWQYPVEYISNRRPVTEEEINMAAEKAIAASTKESFAVIMRPSHVYKGFYMSIPSSWSIAHLPGTAKEITLLMNGNKWRTKISKRGGNSGGLASGWRKFVTDNVLEESDVCLFDIVGSTERSIEMEVKIFRVVEEVTPPNQVNRPPVSKGKREAAPLSMKMKGTGF